MLIHKVVSLIDQDPRLEDLVAQLEEKDRVLDEEISFLKKKAEQCVERNQKEKNPLWALLYEHLKSKNLLPATFSPMNNPNHSLGFNKNQNCVYYQIAPEKNNRNPPNVQFQELQEVPPEVRELLTKLMQDHENLTPH
jgi:hypothetical protein